MKKPKKHTSIIAAACLGMTPWQTASAAPYDQAKIDAGIAVWQDQLDSRGRSCAECHGGPDAFDLAFFNFTAPDIRRRGTPNHVGAVDTEKIVELVQELRKKYDITNPKDPRTTRVFQPGGAPLPGANPTERDAAFLQALQTKMPTLATGTIDTAAKAETGIAELLAYDMRTEPIGILFPIWSEDMLFGLEHGRITDWIADEGMIPNNATARATIKTAKMAYIADPTEAKFWTMYNTIKNNASVRSTVTDSNQRGLWSDKYFNSLIGSHDIKMTQLGLPRIMDKANTRHTQINGTSLVFPTFQIGDNVNTVGSFSTEIRSGIDTSITDEHHVSAGKDAWWWVGFMYNNSFEHEPERHEYFPNSLASNASPRRVDQGSGYYVGHALFTRAKSDFSIFRRVNPVTGVASRFGDGGANPMAPFGASPAIGISLPINPDTAPAAMWANTTHKDQYKRLAINFTKIRLYAAKKQFQDDVAAGLYIPTTFGYNEMGDWNDLFNTRIQLATWDAANSTHNNALITDVDNLRRQAKHGTRIPVINSGNGLNGTYYNSLDFTNQLTTRVDSSVNFVNAPKYFGGANGAIYGTPSGNLSARWTGYFAPKFNDTYKFHMFMAGDDMEWPLIYSQPGQGVSKVWVNNVLVFDMWTTGNRGLDPNPIINFATVTLEAGRSYPITIEYKQSGAYQRAALWHSSSNQIWEPVPQTQLYTAQPAEAVPAAPNNLVLTKLTSTTVRVSWTDYAYNETGFTVQRKTGSAGTWADVGSAGANVLSLDNTGLLNSTTYYYRVRATNALGNSLYSAEASVSSAPGPNVANLLLYEGFDYTSGASLVGLNGGTGWASGSNWATDGTASVVASLSFSDYPVRGYAGKITTAAKTISRSISVAQSTGADVWMSYLFRDASNNDYNDNDVVSFSDANGAKLQTAPARTGANAAAAVDSTWGTAGAAKLANGNVYLIVSKFTKVGTGTSGTPQTATLWAITAAQYDAIKSGGITEAELDANAVAKSTDSFGGAKGLASGNTFKFFNRSGNGFIDEIKLATSLTNLFSQQ